MLNFAHVPLLRSQPDTNVAAALANPSTQYVVSHQLSIVYPGNTSPRKRLPFMSIDEVVATLGISSPSDVALHAVLGTREGASVVALDVTSLPEATLTEKGAAIRPIRTLRHLDHDTQSICGLSLGVMRWRRRHVFCGMCGQRNEVKDAGCRVLCAPCKNSVYPRIDPVIIVLVENAERTHCLVGRTPKYPKGMYTGISGFTEMSESLEETVVREVMEEAGIALDIKEVSYVLSQPWPIGNAAYGEIMMGFRAIAPPGAQPKVTDELEEAIWVSKEDVLKVLDMPLERWASEDVTFKLPPSHTTAYRLLKSFVTSPSKI